MSGISDREIASIRRAQEEFMQDEAEIHRRVVIDGAGEYGKIGPTTKCRIMPGYMNLWREVADRYQGLTMYALTFPVGTDVKDGDRVYDVYGRGFLVRDVKATSSYHTALQVFGEMVENA